MHAFEERWCHAADAEGLRAPEGLALHRRDYRPGLEEEIRWYGYEPPEIVIKALPAPTFDVGAWRTPPTEPTRVLADGDLVDLGDRAFEVLHVPGHTAGSIALWDADSGLLFTGDTAALDDPLYAEDEAAFVASLERLSGLPVELVCAGHSRPFGRDELRGPDRRAARLRAADTAPASGEAHGEHGVGARPAGEPETDHERTARAAPARLRPPLHHETAVVRQVRLDGRRLLGQDLAGLAVHLAHQRVSVREHGSCACPPSSRMIGITRPAVKTEWFVIGPPMASNTT